MLIVGLPYTESELMDTDTGGTPYGASHTAGADSKRPLSATEQHLCLVQGRRLAEIAKRLSTPL
jgi:NAD(P)H dehydrogenase (quinone)